MKIIVCLKEVIDPALSLDNGLHHTPLMVSLSNHSGLPIRLNPDDAAALAMALEIKAADANVEITVISIGAARVESYLRNGLALGADKAIRIWDNDLSELSPYQKAKLLSRAISLSGADLVLTGVKSIDTGSGQVGPLMAGWLGFPCVCNVVGIEPDAEQKSVVIIKDIGRGEREKIRCSLPAVIAVKGEGKLPYAPLDRLIDSKYSEVTLLSPADLGISPIELKKDPARITALTQPRPKPVKTPPLDSSLPAFYRILQLLEGGISKRKGRMLEGNSEEIAEQLFNLFLEEGVIKSAGGKGGGDK
jgi:electron transfer flavoprotein beta subunit